MGIGNTRYGLRNRRNSLFSLPLMGIGNGRTSPGRRAPDSAHYPSWGLETPTPTTLSVAVAFSLPLMGIGNGTLLRHGVQRPVLITPHGDWKLGRTFMAGSPQMYSLPLMGIGNKKELAALAITLSVSLPLMGIGNSPNRLPSCRRGSAHYPSWGLETRAIRVKRSASWTHYPSWGLETQRTPDEAQEPRELITPHGDWKPGTAGRAGSPWPSHYPSWGLETGHHGVARLSGDALITPHGDWKPSHKRRSRSFSRSSLPLMRIGNRFRELDGAATDSSLPLMGIGNTSRTSRDTRRLTSHYPSWGLETCHPEAVLRQPVNSLPLMGIGNKRSAAWMLAGVVTTHYPSWGLETRNLQHGRRSLLHSLPLMGIGNHDPAGRYDQRQPLITPHGDWKRPAGARSRLPNTSHYPSWGLETTGGIHCFAAATFSLPLMGIGNMSMTLEGGVIVNSLPLMGIGNGAPAVSRCVLKASLPLMGIGNVQP